MQEVRGLANQRAVRRHNLGVVLRHVAERGPRSRATIALETGLNKTTVSSLVTELIGLDLLVERATASLEAVRGEGLRPVGAMVAVPGLIDAAGGSLLVAPNLGWKDVPVADELRERLAGPSFP